jgi:hypothetical protein
MPSPSEERRGKVRRLASPAPPEKKARKKWTMEETQMLVEGCNRVRLPFFSLLPYPSCGCGVKKARVLICSFFAHPFQFFSRNAARSG